MKDKDRLLEPYMTTRDEGSGLGLAIVKRIAEDHGGRLELFNPKQGRSGAHVQMCLPLSDTDLGSFMPSAHKISPNLEG